MQPSLLPCVTINPQSPVRFSVIWMHGLGANGHDFEPIVPHLGLQDSWGVRFVFPHAPEIPVTVNGGMVMPAWYDIDALGGAGQDDKDGIERSSVHINALLNHELESGLQSHQIILAGFSQGGALAIHVATRYPQPLAGLIGLSAYLVLEDNLDQEVTAKGRSLKAFMAHGEMDPMVPFEGGLQAANRLRGLGADVTWKTYPMQHEVCLEEMQDIGVWLRSLVAP